MANRPVVVERGSSVAVAYCGRLLGGLGFDVVKAEPPGGDRLRTLGPTVPAPDGGRVSALWEYLGCYKRSVVVGSGPGELDADTLAAAADVVLDDHDGDPGALLARFERTRAANRSVVYVAVSSFGLTGPYRAFRGNDFVDLASSGYLYITGQPDRPPLQPGGPWAGYSTGAIAAASTLAALRAAERDGEGQLVDLGAMEAMASLHQWALTMYTHQGYVKRRAGNRTPESFHPMSFYECGDGWVCLGVAWPAQWESFCLVLDLPELLLDARFETGADRFDHADDLDALIGPRLATWAVADLVEALQAQRVPAGPVLSVADALVDRQLAARRFWAHPVRLGAAARLPERPFRVDGDGPFTPAPSVGEHTAELDRVAGSPAGGGAGQRRPPAAARPGSVERPGRLSLPARPSARSAGPTSGAMFLDGIRVLELTIGWAGPLGGRFMGDFGAEVIHVEAPLSRGAGIAGVGAERAAADLADWTWGTLPGPVFRSGIYPDADPGERPWNRQGVFNKMNRNKLSLCIDLKRPEAHEIFVDLVKSSDVVVNNFSPRGARGLGLDHTTLASYNPRIISVSLSGYGHTGPDSMRFAWGQILEAHSGLAAATGYPGEGPHRMGQPFPDAIAGVHCAIAMLGALHQRDRLGHGLSVDLSQLEAYASIGGELYLQASIEGAAPERHGNASTDFVPQGAYPCTGEDEWLAISVETDEEWAALAGVIGSPLADPAWSRLDGRRAGAAAIDRAIADWSRSRAKHDAMATLQAVGVRASAVMTTGDVVEDPHIAARGFMVEWDQVDVGRRRFPGFPTHFQRPAEMPMRGTSALGGDNAYVLTKVLGYPQSRVDELTESGVLATRPPGA